MRRGRILATLSGGFAAEAVNKLVPLLSLSFVLARLDAKDFGYAQFSYSLIDVAITLVVAGYAQIAIVDLGQSHGEPRVLGRIISEVITLKFCHALLALAGLTAVVLLVPAWHERYATITLALSFLLFTSAFDMSFVHIGTARMLSLSVLTIVAKVISLGLILAFVRTPADLLLFALLYFGTNGLIAMGNCWLNARRFPLAWPRRADLGVRFRRSLPFALTVFLLMALERYDQFFVEHFWGPQGAGLYGGTLRYVQAIASMVVAIATVFYAELVATTDAEALTRHVNLGLWVSFALLMPTAVGAYFLGGELLGVMSAEYRGMGPVFAILVLTLVAHSLVLVYGLQVLMVHRRAAAINAVFVGSIAAGLALCYALSQTMGMPGIAVATLCSRAVAALAFMVLARPYVTSLPKRELVLTAIPAVGMGILLALLGGRSLWLRLAAGAASYGVLLAAFNITKIHRIWSLWTERRAARPTA